MTGSRDHFNADRCENQRICRVFIRKIKRLEDTIHERGVRPWITYEVRILRTHVNRDFRILLMPFFRIFYVIVMTMSDEYGGNV